jgi:hypothetical protein
MHGANGQGLAPHHLGKRLRDSLQPFEERTWCLRSLDWDATPSILESRGAQMPHISKQHSTQEEGAQFLMQ